MHFEGDIMTFYRIKHLVMECGIEPGIQTIIEPLVTRMNPRHSKLCG